ncbi:phd finger protein at3g20280 [Phtheirospermum japonicum]|uniref:Phd finger protein at3g20280 n=1 Tax=Phtheirospermum japonicum TaxID=374723 RepID=A0A830BZR7_9LAMI|nr:phd finger protein at3g20280 [Phtheirospermum japonicum]
MDSTAEVIELGSGVVSGKRPAEGDLDALKENVGSPAKRVRGVSERSLVGDVKKVAEMVLVLAAMGKMRGGKGPTDVEKELMVEARYRLAEVCEGFAPKDVFPRDAFGGVIEDLGLNKSKEQRLGFRPPKMSIAEKLLVSKRKMEKAEEFSLPSTPHSSRLQPNTGASVESRSALHPVQMSQPVSAGPGSFQSASPLGHRSTVNSTSLPYQLPTSEIRPVGSSSLPSSQSSASLPRVDRLHLRSDGRPNGSSHPAQPQANFSANSTVRTPSWPMQPQSALSSKSTSDNKVPVNMSLKVEGAGGVKTGLAPQMMSRAVVGQTLGGPSSQVTNNHAQPPPAGNTHAEIGKIVQKLLQPRVSERPIWNPPSRDYMNKALTCQMCMSTVTEIESILICDACEKGYHIKCLQTTNQKGVPNGEWHCGKCLSLSNGKPLPPKYGRVMRNSITPKMLSNKAPVPSTSIKQVGASNENVGEPKVIGNGHNAMETTPKVAGNNDSHQTSGSESKEGKGIQEIDNVLSRGQIDDKVSSGAQPNNLMENSSSATASSVESLVEKTCVEKVEFDTDSNAELAMAPNSPGLSKAIVNAVNETPSNQCENHSLVRDSKDTLADESSNNAKPLKEQEVVRDNPSGVATSAGAMNQGRSSLDGLHAVNWVGDPLQVVDEKIHYASCCINGHQYKAMDHVLIRGDNSKLIPSKLQAMWEDKNTYAKWVTVNQCYFPGDLPEAVGRPCGLESSEVYESTCGRALLAGLIESPCEVLSPRRFAEETEKRTQLREQLNDPLPPLYVCKWIYDEAKGLFRDMSC